MTSEWTPTPGERVAVLSSHDYGRTRSVEFADVDRVGKRDIVLADGRRFRVRDMEMPTSGTWVSSRTRLVKMDDPVVKAVEQEQEHRAVLSFARGACEDFRYQKGVSAADVILALAPLTGVRAEIEALFAKEQA